LFEQLVVPSLVDWGSVLLLPSRVIGFIFLLFPVLDGGRFCGGYSLCPALFRGVFSGELCLLYTSLDSVVPFFAGIQISLSSFVFFGNLIIPFHGFSVSERACISGPTSGKFPLVSMGEPFPMILRYPLSRFFFLLLRAWSPRGAFFFRDVGQGFVLAPFFPFRSEPSPFPLF